MDMERSMNNLSLKTILISAVGNTDPFNKLNDTRYGPLLSVALKYKPDEIYTLVTDDIFQSHKYRALEIELKHYLPNTKLALIGGEPFLKNDAVNSDKIFSFLKLNLNSKIREQTSYSEIIFNANSGTPQMKNALKIISRLYFPKSKIIQVKRERENKLNETAKEKDLVWKDYKINSNVVDDLNNEETLNILNDVETDYNYYLLINSLNILIDNYEYYPAKKFAIDFNSQFELIDKEKFEILLTFLDLMRFLIELNITEPTKKKFNKLTNIFDKKTHENIKQILFKKEGESITKIKINLGHKLISLYKKKYNLSQTVKLIAVLRELFIINVLVPHINSKERLYTSLKRDDIKKELLEFLDNYSGGKYNSSEKLNNFTATGIIKFACNTCPEYANLEFLFNNVSQRLTEKRNQISHMFETVTEDDFDNALYVFEKLKNLCSEYDYLDKNFPDIFDELNLKLKEFVRTL